MYGRISAVCLLKRDTDETSYFGFHDYTELHFSSQEPYSL